MALFGNLFHNYYYGKAGKGDYTIEQMPQNRRQLFFEIFKVRWSSLFGVNLLYMIVWIPTIIWTFINFAVIQSAEADTWQAYFTMYLLILFPCIAITGPFNAGITYILRNWARDEHSFVLSDFKDALKANWKGALLLSTISGILPVAVYVAWTFYGSLASQSFIYMLPMALVFFVAIVWKLSEMVMFTMLVTYDLSIKNVIRNSILVTIGKLPRALIIKLITFLLPAIMLALCIVIPSIEAYVILIGSLLYICYLVAFHKLIICSYANWACETYLNPRIEGARTNIGLRPENWDDVEYIPQDDEPQQQIPPKP